ncbi:MAG: type IV pilin protein [Microcystaceae cyanobacterium]
MNANFLNPKFYIFPSHRSDKGFNLMELMIVLVILSLLAAIAIPQLFTMVTKTRETEVQHQIATIVQAQNRYYLENGTFLKITKKQMQNNDHDLEVTIDNPKYNIRTTLATNYNAVRVKASATGDDQKRFKNYTAGLHYSRTQSASVFCQTHNPGGDITGIVQFTLSSSEEPSARCDIDKGREIR